MKQQYSASPNVQSSSEWKMAAAVSINKTKPIRVNSPRVMASALFVL